MNAPTSLPPFAPVPRLVDRSNGWKPEVQLAFIEALADTGSVRAACRQVGRTEHGAYQLRRHPEAGEFRAAWEAALALGIRRIEDVAMDRALNGVEVPVYSYGQLVGTRVTYNDRLLMFLLRNRAPDRFAEGGAKAMNAIDRMELKRLKKQWRKEWEAQLPRRQMLEAAEARRMIDAKLEQLRQRVLEREARRWERLSDETRAAHAEYMRLRERDLAKPYVLGGAVSKPQASQARLAARSACAEDIAGAQAGAGDR